MSRRETDPSTGWYYNTRTRQVEQGPLSDFIDRLGPYPTREAAAEALQTAARRNATWDAEDRAWDEDEENDR
jgi:hypothetical protein